MDSASVKPQLPPVGYMDIEKARRDEDAYQKHYTGPAPSSMRSSTAPSPTWQYPTGPPPPYSHPAPQQSRRLDGTLPNAQSGAPPPPESRRTSDEKEAVKQVIRQSLPSISEALGVDNQSTYHTSLLNNSTPTPLQTGSAKRVATSPPSPRRAYAMEPPQMATEHHVSAHSHYSQYRQDTPSKPTFPPMDTQRHGYIDSRQHHSSQHHVQAPPSPRSAREQGQYAPPPTSPRPELQPAPPASMPPPATPSFSYGYTPYPPRYAQPLSAVAPTTTGPIYQPSIAHAAPPTPAASLWKSEQGAKFASDERMYGDSVKRHLDMHDIEAALTDITHTSSSLTDFSRRYGDRLHHTARSEPSLSTLPSIIEVEDMITKSRLQLEALSKIREVVIAQQIAFDQQAAEQQHSRLQQKSQFSDSTSTPSVDGILGDGFEAKKRRGRAAPPGRCHSCNRAETPEWRRGPDGARTLCNACGLHYAKLTRKQNSAQKSTGANGVNGSNGGGALRPKESV